MVKSVSRFLDPYECRVDWPQKLVDVYTAIRRCYALDFRLFFVFIIMVVVYLST